MENIKFQATKHQKLWKAMRNSWYLVKKFGTTDTKLYLCRSLLNDKTDLFNACYACEYDRQIAKSKGEKPICKYCPIIMENCRSDNSILFQLSLVINEGNRFAYEKLCTEMANAPIKSTVKYD